jgi:hypothetical protein
LNICQLEKPVFLLSVLCCKIGEDLEYLFILKAHGRAVILSAFKSEVDRTINTLSAPLQHVLRQLVELYFYYWTLEKLGDLLLVSNYATT